MDIIIPILSGLIGLVAGLVIPFVKWHVEKLNLRHNERKQLIANLRDSICSESFEEGTFIHTELYSRFRKYLSADTINQLEKDTKLIGIVIGHKRFGIKYDLLERVNQLEKEWKLI